MRHTQHLVLLLWLASAALLLGSCKPLKTVPLRSSVERLTLLRDTVVKTTLVPYADSVAVLDSLSVLANPYAESRVEIRHGRLLCHTLRTLPAEIEVKLSLPQTSIRSVEQLPVFVEKPLSRWQQMKLKFGGWAAALLAAALLLFCLPRFFR